jgi:adenylate kinase family enzyme
MIFDANYAKSHECHLEHSIALKLSADSIKEAFETVRSTKPLKALKGEWKRRLLVVGRVGSGRKTQAALIAQEFSLVLIDLDNMIAEYEQQSSLSSSVVLKPCHEIGFWGFIQEALVKPQCLHNGYVIVSNVISKEMLRILFEKFIHSPNQIMFLHTNESKCRRRITRACAAYDNNLHKFLNYHMNLYNLYKQEFVDYVNGLKCQVYHINGNGRVDDIKNRMWAYLVRS